MAYLDHASLTPPHPAAVAAMADAPWADPTRLYREARRARMALDAARAACAEAIGGRADEVTFTSGGTEALALAIGSALRAAPAARKPARVVVSAIEQRSVLDTLAAADGIDVVTVGVDASGRVSPDAVAEAIGDGAALACVQVANGEIGTVQPIEAIAEIARERRTWLLADASHAAGWMPLDVSSLGADLVAVSGSRCGGSAGTGLLWTRGGVRLRPMLPGDDRERGIRAGMPNLAGIVGLGAGLAARVAELPAAEPAWRAMTARLREQLPSTIADVIVHGHPSERLPHLVSFSIPLVEGDALLLGLDREGFAVHSGSACASGTDAPSHVLAAIGTLTHGAIRVSIGPGIAADDLDRFIEVLPGIVAAARDTLRSR